MLHFQAEGGEGSHHAILPRQIAKITCVECLEGAVIGAQTGGPGWCPDLAEAQGGFQLERQLLEVWAPAAGSPRSVLCDHQRQ